MTAPATRRDRLAHAAWGVLAATVGVVLWGAYVRASGSGAGCGAHWPLCNGEVVPRAPAVATLVELTHRVTSGALLASIFALGVALHRHLPRPHRARAAVGASVVFIVTEALIGAGLVLFGLVADDTSHSRAVVLGLHLANTFLLLAALALTARWAGRPSGIPWRRSRTALTSVLALGGCLLVSVSGAIAALGDTLFPAASLTEGLAQDLSPTSHLLIRLRLLHPWLAVLFALLLVGRVRPLVRHRAATVPILARGVIGLVAAQVLLGLLNVLLRAPIWLQLVHLAAADGLWIVLVLLVAELMDLEAEARGVSRPQSLDSRASHEVRSVTT